MAIVINDFEVIPREEGAQRARSPQAAPAPAASHGLTLTDLQRVERHARQRALRLWAH